MKTLSPIGCFVLSVCVAAPLFSQEKPAEKEKKAPAPQAVNAVLKQLEEVDLSAEQSKKVKEIVAEYSPKLQAAQKAIADLLTPEQKKARAEAAAKNKADGLKGKEAAEAILAALKITAEQQASFDAADKAAKETNAAFRKAIAGVLTDEQRAKTNLGGPKKPPAK